MLIDRLIHSIKEKGTPIAVGLDPRFEHIPPHIMDAAINNYGKTPKAVAEAFLSFNKGIIDGVCDIVPAVKLQFAMYEQYGSDGVCAFAQSVKYAKNRGLIVIGDVKRSDIASSAEAYSDGHIGMVNIRGESREIFGEDFITINPYLGSDSIEPFLENCKKYDRGLFVLVKTSNPGSSELQNIKTHDGTALYGRVCELVSKWGAELRGEYGYSNIGAVVGATYPAEARALREQFPNVFFLIPGYGAQGASADDISVCFDSNGLGGIINNSRGIIAAYQHPAYRERFTEYEFAAASVQAVTDMRDSLQKAIKIQ